MKAISAVNPQINPVNQPKNSDSKANNASSISFNNVFEVVRRSMDGVMVVAENNRAGLAEFKKEKLEIEEKRQFRTDLEEAQEILNQIARIMEKQERPHP